VSTFNQQSHQGAAEAARELAKTVSAMGGRIDALEAQNAALRQQLDLIQQHGVAFTPETAKTWIDSVAAADPVLWKRIQAGNGFTSKWDTQGGFAVGGNLSALLLDLGSIPARPLRRGASR
jgi:hypothetical protein